MSSTWEGILASIFKRFWWILGGKLGSKIEQKSIQEGIEKVMKKKVTKIAKKALQEPAAHSGTGKMDPGKGVGGRVNPSPERGKGSRKMVAL